MASEKLTWRSGMAPLYTVEKPPFTIEVPGAPQVPGETRPRRHPAARDGLVTRPHPDVDTVFALLKRSAEVHAGEPAAGSRRLVRMHTETKRVTKVVGGKPAEVDKEWQYFELSDYAFVTYAEYEARVLALAAGLRRLGLQTGDRVHMFASTSMNWLAMSHACSYQSMAIATAYDTLGPAGVEYTIRHSRPAAMYTDPHLLRVAAGALAPDKDGKDGKAAATTVRVLIYNDAAPPGHPPTPQADIDAFKAAHPNLKVLSVGELAELGRAHPANPVPPSPDDVYCVMYTSGSTGPPKGVTVTHRSFVASMAGLFGVLGRCVSDREVVLAYLPLAHIFEMIVENLVLFIGGTLGYGSPRTLADASVRGCRGDMRALRPTVIVGVPQVWETLKKGIVRAVDGGGALARAAFWAALAVKSALVRWGLPGPAAAVLDPLVFGEVRRLTGGRLRLVVNGASGIADSTHHFVSMVLAPMISGYGLTETCGNGALGDPLQYVPGVPGAIGPVPPSVEVKLVSVPELGYDAEASPPRGEILIRGAPVLREYWDNPEETAKALTADGWFRSGDVGLFDANGHLHVVDRIKNIVKLLGGEYIALEKMEAVYRGSRAVHNIMVHGSPEHPRPIAVVCVNDAVVREMASGAGAGDAGSGLLLRDPAVVAVVLRDLQAQGRAAGLSGLEIVSGVVLTDDEWTPANGYVTATQKVNRRVLKEKYKAEIEQCFKSL